MPVSERVRLAIDEDVSLEHLCWAVGDDGDLREAICVPAGADRVELRVGRASNAIDCLTGHRFARSWGVHDSRLDARDYLSETCGFHVFFSRAEAEEEAADSKRFNF